MKNKLINFKYFANDRNLVFISIIFFVIYKFVLITIAFYGRNLAPEPDDSYTYISLINLVYEKGLFSNTLAVPAFSYLHTLYIPYVATLAILAKIFFLNSEQIFKLTFYLGSISLAFVLLYFISNLTNKKKLIAFTTFFLALYNGSGAYHGFYWVVPSFFAFLLFLILFTQLITKSKKWYIWSIVTSALFVLVHPISIYASIIFVFFPILLSTITKKIQWEKLKRGIFITSTSVFWFILSRIYFVTKGIKLESESSISGIKRAFVEYTGFLTDRIGNVKDLNTSQASPFTHLPISYVQLDNWQIIKSEYLDILFPSPIFLLIFALFFFILFKKKQYYILALYLATVVFLAFGTITWFGYRALGYLWPITFLFIAYGTFFTLEFLFLQRKSLLKQFSVSAIYLGIMILIFTLSTLNFVWAKDLNLSSDYDINNNCRDFLLNYSDADSKINYEGKTAYTLFLSLGLFDREANLDQSKQNEGEFVVAKTNKAQKRYSNKNAIVNFILENTSRRKQTEFNTSAQKTPRNYNIQNPVKSCGDFKIYKITKNNTDI